MHSKMPNDTAWLQYGIAILEQVPEETWEQHILKIPIIYRDLIRTKLMLAKAARDAKEDAGATQQK